MCNHKSFDQITKNGVLDSCFDFVGNVEQAKVNKDDEVDHVLTNFDEDELNIYKEALAIYGNTDMYISDIACDVHGRRIIGCKSLHAIGKKDRSGFWRIFHKVKENHQQLFLVEKEIEL